MVLERLFGHNDKYDAVAEAKEEAKEHKQEARSAKQAYRVSHAIRHSEPEHNPLTNESVDGYYSGKWRGKFADSVTLSDPLAEGHQRLDTPLVVYKHTSNGYVMLLIPAGTRVYISGNVNSKCRAARAVVMGMEKRRRGGRQKFISQERLSTIDGERTQPQRSGWDKHFKYRFGDVVEPKGSFSMKKKQCASGIHFYIHPQAALQ